MHVLPTAFTTRDSLTGQIARHLEQRIILGDMKPGERIQELRIAAELQVSRGSVREALLILQRRHLVEIFPRRGAVVASISPQDVKAFFALWLLLLDQLVKHLARTWQDSDLDHLHTLLSQMDHSQQAGDLALFYQQGMDFLQCLYQTTDNRYLADALLDWFPLTQRCLYAILRAGQSHIHHTWRFLQELMKTITERDLERQHHMLFEFGDSVSQLAQASVHALQGRHEC